MNLRMPHARLTRLIHHYAAAANESRQVARRLGELLPERFHAIRRRHLRYGSAAAEREALTDPRYLATVEEWARIAGEATAARVQYETHVMLYQARQSLAGQLRTRKL